MKCVICGKEIAKSGYSNAILCDSKCFSKHFWNMKVDNKNNEKQAVINGSCYFIGNENADRGYDRGYYGRQFIIKFNDGRLVKTTNLWYNGVIPADFKELLPDNAIFVQEELS